MGHYAAAIGIFTAVLTSFYSWRLIFRTFHGDYKNDKINIKDIHESPLVMLIPLFILSLGAIFSGFIFKDIFLSHEDMEFFWRNSITFLKPLNTDHPPLWFLILTPFLVTISIPFSYFLILKNKSILKNFIVVNKPLYNFLKKKWYFDELYNFLFTKFFMKLGIFFWKIVDIKIIDRFGPDGLSSLIKFFSLKASKFQSGFIYQYAFVMLIGFSILLTYLILKS